MHWLTRTIRTSIGAKIVMALTGILMLLFVIGHLAGNLQVFAGRDTFNSYAHFLKSKPALLWSARLGLLAVLAAHVLSALRLTRRNQEARPVPYQVQRVLVSTLAARSMVFTGMTLLAYIAYHLSHFTLGLVHGDAFGRLDDKGRQDVFSLLVASFQQPVVVFLYLAAMVLLGLHLRHGVSSFFQTLGLNHARYNPLIRWISPVVATLIVIGYVSIPLAVLSGFVPEGAAP